MSRLYFHSPHGQAELRGAERMHLSALVRDTFIGHAGVTGCRCDYLIPLLPPDCYLLRDPHEDRRSLRWEANLRTYLSVADGDFIINGEPIQILIVALNTACALGNDVLKLAARLDGQCEIHAYVEGPHRAWLADLIDTGRKARILRPDLGWDQVATLLRARADEPVVTSFSVCEPFPHASLLDELDRTQWPAELAAADPRIPSGDLFDDLDEETQWAIGMQVLRARAHSLELSPTNWQEFYFVHPIMALDLPGLAAQAHQRQAQSVAR